MSRPFMPCGTPAAYTRHRRNGEDPCPACMEAKRDDTRNRRAGTPRPPKRQQKLAPCGTKSARQRHKRYGETCPECDAIKNATLTAAARASGDTRRTTPAPEKKQRRTANRDIGTTAWMWGPLPTIEPRVARRAAATVTRHVDAADVPAVLTALGIEQEAA